MAGSGTDTALTRESGFVVECSLGRSKLAQQTNQRHILRDRIMRDQGVTPRLAAVAGCVSRSMLAPFYGSFLLGLDFPGVHFAASFRFQHVDRVRGFCDEVGLILGGVSARLVVNLELAFRWLEPL